MQVKQFVIVPYRSKAFDYAAFSCGERSMDLWLQQVAGQNERLNRSRTFLLVSAVHESRDVHGYFSLVNCQITPSDASAALRRPQKYPIPSTLLTRLAVSTTSQGEGLGSMLLGKAMMFTLAALEYSASELLIVDAIDEDAISFYQRHGFELIHDDGRRLFITTRRISASLDASHKDP